MQDTSLFTSYSQVRGVVYRCLVTIQVRLQHSMSKRRDIWGGIVLCFDQIDDKCVLHLYRRSSNPLLWFAHCYLHPLQQVVLITQQFNKKLTNYEMQCTANRQIINIFTIAPMKFCLSFTDYSSIKFCFS